MPIPTKQSKELEPYWTTTDGNLVRLYQGNVTEVLRRLPAKSVHMIVTSPPYWGLRSYLDEGHDSKTLEIGSEPTPDCLGWAWGENCGKCHVCKMVLVGKELRRVLRDDGTCWINYGDSYGGLVESRSPSSVSGAVKGVDGNFARPVGQATADGDHQLSTAWKSGLKAGNLVGVPWRVALALQADGWVLRQDIVWSKKSPMPESVRNRCTKAHEYIFLLAKEQGYYYDAEAIKEEQVSVYSSDEFLPDSEKDRRDEDKHTAATGASRANRSPDPISSGRNKRSVWVVSSAGYPGAHFATFPPKLIEPCILAGTSAHGCCSNCGAPWERILETKQLKRERPHDYVKRTGEEGTGNSCANSVAGVETKTVGWRPTCICGGDYDVVPCTVLDPFCGSGTTCCVALGHGRRSIGIDLSEKYLRLNAIPRIEGAMMERPALAKLIPKKGRGT